MDAEPNSRRETNCDLRDIRNCRHRRYVTVMVLIRHRYGERKLRGYDTGVDQCQSIRFVMSKKCSAK